MTERLSDDDLDRLEALAEGATPGPWEDRIYDLNDVVMVVHDCEYVDIVAELGDKGTDRVLANAEFVAAVRNAFPALVAEVRAHRERKKRPITIVCDPPRPMIRPLLVGPCWYCGR